MSLDDYADPLVTALGALLPTAVNAGLQATLGEDAIAHFASYPVSLGALGAASALPCLAAWRLEDRLDETESDYDHAELTILRLDYYAAPCPIDALSSRWQLLRGVWFETSQALMKGGHPDVSDGADVMRAVGVRRIDRVRSRVRYAFAAQGELVVPSFNAEVALEMVFDDFDIGIIPADLLATLRLLHSTYALDPSAVETSMSVYPPLTADLFDVGLG